jgi:prepilin signal peptidase PulO-like enzyme (type II secretory pathway)
MDLSGWPGAVLLGVLGLVFGSLASALSHRLPRGEAILLDRSRCPNCRTPLTARDLLPVVSWLATSGRCRHCRHPVSWRYPFIELITAGLFVACWWRGDGDLVLAGLLAFTAFGLVVIVVADLEAGIIPDAMLLVLVPAALAWRWHSGADWSDAAAGAAAGLGLTWAARAGFKAWRGHHGLGLGDVKFSAVAGLYLGLAAFGWFLALAGVLGLVFGVLWRLSGRDAAFPLGPALCVALLAALFEPGLVAPPV